MKAALECAHVRTCMHAKVICRQFTLCGFNNEAYLVVDVYVTAVGVRVLSGRQASRVYTGVLSPVNRGATKRNNINSS